MRFFHFIKKYYRIRFAPYCLGQLAALVIAYISRRRSDQTRYGMLLHVLAHIDTHHIALIIKERIRQRFGELRLTYTGRPQEQERTDRLARILDPCLGTDDGLTYLGHRFVLSDHTLVQFLVQMQRLVALTLIQLAYRDAGPAGNDPRDLFLRYILMHQTVLLLSGRFFLDLQLFLQIRQSAVGQLSGSFIIALPLCDLDLVIDRLDLLTDLGHFIDRRFFILPLCLGRFEFFLLFRQFL